jgi:hypothetical protein
MFVPLFTKCHRIMLCLGFKLTYPTLGTSSEGGSQAPPPPNGFKKNI